MFPPPPRSTLFPYTTLFRSSMAVNRGGCLSALDLYLLDRGLKTLGLRMVAHNRNALEIAQWLERDRKSTRLNSSHANISYAVFCLKKKKKLTKITSKSMRWR